jgi:predicted short-subunit dehydrogenase-like oxidoreductase (DUF2520 family)
MINRKADKRICIIGIGKVGSAFAVELSNKGFDVKFLVDTNKSTLKKISSKIKSSSSDLIAKEFITDADVIFLTVQDSKLHDAVTSIKNLNIDLSGKMFIHTSGSLSSKIFRPLKVRKELIASFHPIQTFNSISLKNNYLLRGIYFGVEGGEIAKEFLGELVVKIESRLINIPSSKKPLYHLASVIASNFFVTNLAVISEILKKLGIKDEDAYNIYEGIIERTIENIKTHGITESLTGPVDRNDHETIESHIEYIKKHIPEIERYYKEVTKLTSKVALKKGSLSKKQYEDLNRHIKKKA